MTASATPPVLLQVSAVVNSGGVGRIVEQIGRTALAAGWRSVVAYGRRQGSSASELLRIGSGWDVRRHALRTRLLDDHGFGSAGATRALVRRLEALAPSLVHLHNLHGYYVNIQVLAEYLARSGVPVVWTLHDCWPFTGHCCYFDYAGCPRWRSGCHTCPETRTYPASLWRDRSRRNWQQKRALFGAIDRLTLVPVSRWLAGLAQQSFLGDKPVRQIYNGTDTEVFAPAPAPAVAQVRAQYGLNDRFVVLGCASEWVPRKGLGEFGKLRARCGDDVAIVVVGVTSRQQAQLPPGVTGVRRTESVAQLAALYSAADLVVNPSFEDNFPTVNLEALSCGTPVCTYRSGGSPEAVTSQTGFVVDQGDVEGVVRAIGQVRARGSQAYAVACRDRVLSAFRQQDRWGEYLALYGQLLGAA